MPASTLHSAPNHSALFARLRKGDDDVLGDIVEAFYTKLHLLAASRMRHETRRHTLQATALVHEAYMRLKGASIVINDRQHFFALAAQAMRRTLVDHARQKHAGKRGGRMNQVPLELVPGQDPLNFDFVALDEALSTLSAFDARAAQVVDLRFFGGLTDQEVSEILGVKIPTVRRDWVFARKWLHTHLKPVASA